MIKERLLKVKSDFNYLKNDSKSLMLLYQSWGKKTTIIFLSFIILLCLCFFADEYFREFVKTVHNSFFDELFAFGHWYGKPQLTIYSFFIFYIGGLIILKDGFRNVGIKLFEAFIFSGIIITVVKSIFGRWRPYTDHGSFSFVFFTFGPNDHLSLPSGDVAVAFTFSVIMSGIYKNTLWKILWYLLAVITAAGRIYHDQHWLSDVVLAAFIAIVVGLKVNKLSEERVY
jgi:membrane-associated phospholipid phosphatase